MDDIFYTNFFAGLPSYLRIVGSVGTSPYDQGDGSVTGLFGTVPVWGSLSSLVNPGADGPGKFGIDKTAVASWLQTQGLSSDNEPINTIESITIAGLGEALGFFAADGRLVFGLFVGEGGLFNFRLFDQLDHEGTYPAQADSLSLGFSAL